MKTRTEMITSVKLLTGMLLSVALAVPMVVEAGRGHHRHHHHHHDHHDHHDHHYYSPGPGYGGYGYGRPQHHKHRHVQHNHYNTRNIYYNQPYYPPAYGGYYGAAPGNFFLGISTGDARFMLGY
ncbi:hypothetical protein [Nitrosomonas sp. Nm132]|uniref:hypothetical protein n=1 Tax=Nitrosomonas sp. Nm132 TaxID=1881053 RepID=UPI0008814BD5|nr:hypothetical protein [Nitrosomonas sp. Nm132]SDH48321.1 hypothetical protein SAMN05428952_101530 [Nitrosomonas sp. Nm132]